MKQYPILAGLLALGLLAACNPNGTNPTTPPTTASKSPTAPGASPSATGSTAPTTGSPSPSASPAASMAPLAAGMRLTMDGTVVTTPTAPYAGLYAFADKAITWRAQVSEFKGFYNPAITMMASKEMTPGFTVADVVTLAISIVQYDAAGTVVNEWAYLPQGKTGLTLDTGTTVKGTYEGPMQKSEFGKENLMNVKLEFNLPYPEKSSK